MKIYKKEHSFLNQRLFSRDFKSSSCYSFSFEVPRIAPVIARQASVSLIVSEEVMCNRLGHQKYHDNLAGFLQKFVIINLEWGPVKALYMALMLVFAKSLATYEKVLLLY